MNDIIWHNDKRKVNDLIPFEENPRKMSEKDVFDLRASLEKFNLCSVPVIDIDDKIVGGHQRLKILQLLGRGEEEIDVRIPNRKLTQEEFIELNLRLNQNQGKFDYNLLANFDEKMLIQVGFSEEELMLNFGLNEVNKNQVDEDRLEVLTVLPPEAPRLKERLEIHCDTILEYNELKKAVENGKINKEVLLKMI